MFSKMFGRKTDFVTRYYFWFLHLSAVFALYRVYLFFRDIYATLAGINLEMSSTDLLTIATALFIVAVMSFALYFWKRHVRSANEKLPVSTRSTNENQVEHKAGKNTIVEDELLIRIAGHSDEWIPVGSVDQAMAELEKIEGTLEFWKEVQRAFGRKPFKNQSQWASIRLTYCNKRINSFRNHDSWKEDKTEVHEWSFS